MAHLDKTSPDRPNGLMTDTDPPRRRRRRSRRSRRRAALRRAAKGAVLLACGLAALWLILQAGQAIWQAPQVLSATTVQVAGVATVAGPDGPMVEITAWTDAGRVTAAVPPTLSAPDPGATVCLHEFRDGLRGPVRIAMHNPGPCTP